MFEIDFKRGPDVKERLQRSGFDAMVPISVESDRKSITEELHDRYTKVYIWLTIPSLIGEMERYGSPCSFKIPIEQAGIYVESDGQNVELGLYAPGPKQASEWHSDPVTAPLQEFAAEAITTTEEFIEYFVDVCPEYTEEDVQPYREYVADARTWYEQKYGETV